MHIKVVLDNVSQITWLVRVVFQGERYGKDHSETHRDDDPLVEFYDTRYPHSNLGQFVSRYYASTLLQNEGRTGLNLEGGVADWYLHGSAHARALEWVESLVPEVV